jgi:ElaB/YqjD/DUF883 family membrane-anchored ribosome-binding protein
MRTDARNGYGHVVDEVDRVLRGWLDEARKHGSSRQARALLRKTRKRLTNLEHDLEREVRHTARTADRYLHDSPWVAVGAVAAVAFVVGCIVAGRER